MHVKFKIASCDVVLYVCVQAKVMHEVACGAGARKEKGMGERSRARSEGSAGEMIPPFVFALGLGGKAKVKVLGTR